MDFKVFETLAREYCQAELEVRAATAKKKGLAKQLDEFFDVNMTEMGELIKRKFSWSDLGTFTTKPETVVYAYGDSINKQKLFGYAEKIGGIESAWKLFPAHYGALNSFYVSQANAEDNPKLIIPGCYEPITKLKYGFRKK